MISIFNSMVSQEVEGNINHEVYLFDNGYGASVIQSPKGMFFILIRGTSANDYHIEGDDNISVSDFEDLYNALTDIAEGNIEDYYF